MGQGGFTCQRFVAVIDEPVTVALRSPIPLETELEVVQRDDRWHLIDPADPATIILEATLWDPNYASCDAVSIDDAGAARDAFSLTAETHPAPHCMSCGIHDRSLNVHAGPLGDGRWASPLRMPEWSLIDGEVDVSLLWMAMDCSCGWYISQSGPDHRKAVTVQFAVDIHEPIAPETDYSLVAWNGDYDSGWDGRKRGSAAALFDAAGTQVASSRSFWVAPR